MISVLKVSRSPTIFQRQDNSDLCLPFLSRLFVSAKTPWRNLCYSDRNIGYSGVIQPGYKYLIDIILLLIIPCGTQLEPPEYDR